MDTENTKTLNIKVTVGDRTYPMKVGQEEEERIRKAAKLVTAKVKELEAQYSGTDKQDFMAMAALMFAIDSLDKGSKVEGIETGFADKLIELDNTLSTFLNEK